MRKPLYSILCICLLSTSLLIGCHKAPAAFNPRAPLDPNKVIFQTEKLRYPKGTQKIKFTVQNKNDVACVYGLAYSIEQLDKGAWTPVPCDKSIVWGLSARTIDAHSKCTDEINTKYVYGTLPVGTYRIVKVFNLKYKSTAAFQIIEPEK